MDCVTGSPMADTCVRQVVVIDDGVKCPRDTQLETASPGGLRGVVQKGLGVCVSRAGLVARDGEGRCGRGTSPLSLGRLMLSLRYPRGTQTVVVSGRVRGRGPARVQVVTDSLQERSATPQT